MTKQVSGWLPSSLPLNSISFWDSQSGISGMSCWKIVSIWLKAHIELLLERVMRKDTRPLLLNTDRRAALERLLKEREPVYSEADITVESDGGPHEIVVKRILAALPSSNGAGKDANLDTHS